MMKDLKTKLDSLCVFRELLEDEVIASLCSYLERPTNSSYAAFVGALYRANGGNISEHIRTLCENSENVCVRLLGRGEPLPAYMEKALSEELDVLQQVAALTAQTLREPLKYDGYLPEFATAPIRLRETYRHRLDNIGQYGYGIYARNRMFRVEEPDILVPVANPDPIRLSDLVEYERERKIIVDNTEALLAGKPAANILLTGDAGTGKSSTVKAVGNELFDRGLRIIEVRKDQLRAIPAILGRLAENPLKFILFLDDLSFLKDDDSFNALKAVLEGSVSAKTRNVVLYATSNRRHIVREKQSDRDGDEVNRNETMQEMISLSERFGIHISFYKPAKSTFLHIVRHLAEENCVDMPQEELERLAERFALERGGRSARLARQFVDGLVARPRCESDSDR